MREHHSVAGAPHGGAHSAPQIQSSVPPLQEPHSALSPSDLQPGTAHYS